MKTKLISISPLALANLRSKGLTVDEAGQVVPLEHRTLSDFTGRERMDAVEVYRYKVSNLPETVSAAEIARRNRQRWEEFYDAE